ncbi:MAG: ubiquitin-specific protease ubp2 [Bathelium mastoideum]|nr:MAG: ubiquitin-specific protease ubp2 [Bathelium mastoideum]
MDRSVSSQLRSRYDAAVSAEPARGFEEASGALALFRLHTYLRDGLDAKFNRSHFPKNNKFFLVTFGDDCDNFLRSLGFAEEEDSEGKSIWRIPRPPPKDNVFDQASHRAFLECVVEELDILIFKKPTVERQTVKNFIYQPIPSRKDLERVLGMLDYEKISNSRTFDPNVPEHPYYASLGAVADFSDNLILYSYDRQVECDVENSPYYFECLQDLATGRNSEALQTKVATLASQDQISRKDIAKAYQYFGVDKKHVEIISDDHILGLFQSRLPDIGPSQESEMREMLRTLARARRSKLLAQAASNTIETYGQALSWLGAEESTADDFILTLFKMKVDENAAHREPARKAVQLVADTRKSKALESFLTTGKMFSVDMDPADAFRVLDLDLLGRDAEDDYIVSVYQTRLVEAPEREWEFISALKAIAKDRDSRRLKEVVDLGLGSNVSATGPPMHDIPVGLHNLAVTCYLNSVIQLFFSLKPFRNLVLNIDRYMMEMTPQDLQSKRVGGAVRTAKEVDLSQQFAVALAALFDKMIHADTRIVKYDTEFARLALASLSKDLVTRRRSTVGGHRPSIVQSIQDERRLQSLAETENDQLQQEPLVQVSGSQHSSQETLVDTSMADAAKDEGWNDSKMADVDTLQPTSFKNEKYSNSKSLLDQTSDPMPLDEDDYEEHVQRQNTPTMVNTEGPALSMIPEGVGNDDEAMPTLAETSTAENLPPTRAAPKPELPPRQTKNDQKVSELAAVEDTAKQQDAAEVTDNIVSKIRTAIAASGHDERLEQIDPVRNVLFGIQKDVIIRPNGQEDTQTNLFDVIRLHLPAPMHIYEALDDAFDIQDKQLDGGIVQGYTSISACPPVLGIQIERGIWDAVNQRSSKVEHHLQLDDLIYLDRYMETAHHDDLFALKQQKWQLRTEQAALEAERAALVGPFGDLDGPTTVDDAAKFITCLEDAVEDEDSDSTLEGDGAPSLLRAKSAELNLAMYNKKQEIEKLREHINASFAHLHEHSYRLYALCMHRGNPGFGHYWVYIHDFINGVWRKYNDDKVEVVDFPEIEIFQPSEEKSPIPTPHYIMYVREDRKELVGEPLCRRPLAGEKDADVEMETMNEDW